jgi:hypothetical protein
MQKRPSSRGSNERLCAEAAWALGGLKKEGGLRSRQTQSRGWHPDFWLSESYDTYWVKFFNSAIAVQKLPQKIIMDGHSCVPIKLSLWTLTFEFHMDICHKCSFEVFEPFKMLKKSI